MPGLRPRSTPPPARRSVSPRANLALESLVERPRRKAVSRGMVRPPERIDPAAAVERRSTRRMERRDAYSQMAKLLILITFATGAAFAYVAGETALDATRYEVSRSARERDELADRIRDLEARLAERERLNTYGISASGALVGPSPSPLAIPTPRAAAGASPGASKAAASPKKADKKAAVATPKPSKAP